MKEKSKMVLPTILSMSLLTVMAGAAIAPALGIIKEHFSETPELQVKLIVSMPALFIILTNVFFLKISQYWHSRKIAFVGLLLYVLAGSGCFLLDDIVAILLLRAALGISVGLIMPLSTGLLSLYYPPEQQARLMGLSAAMNQMGGVVATFLAGFLSTIEWRYAFLVYLLGLISLLMVVLYLPKEQLKSENKRGKTFEIHQLLKFHPSVGGMLLLMIVFFVFPTNFAVIAAEQTMATVGLITIVMVALDVVAFIAGLYFGKIMSLLPRQMKYVAPVFFLLGYIGFVYGTFLPICIGAFFVGIANGVGVPYLLTIASIKGGRNSATTVMPMLSAALYMGQFLSPIVIELIASALQINHLLTAPYIVATIVSGVFLLQVFATRKYQSLPPNSN